MPFEFPKPKIEMPKPDIKVPEVHTPSNEPPLTEKQKLLAKAIEILKEHDNQESNIPVNSEYWDLMNRYRRS